MLDVSGAVVAVVDGAGAVPVDAVPAVVLEVVLDGAVLASLEVVVGPDVVAADVSVLPVGLKQAARTAHARRQCRRGFMLTVGL